ncbi:hypothetical protein ACFVGM_33135 [Kitasatospora purpeofusca]|uniref:hypothetical protein n=1 Tax=Kitasatospora purpeofusca TaxID=67352 RepID=UPI0036B6A21A
MSRDRIRSARPPGPARPSVDRRGPVEDAGIAADTAPDLRRYVEALRAQVLGPVQERGIAYRRLSELLTERFGGGYGPTTVQRIGFGAKVPSREVLDHLLDLADDPADPLGDTGRSAVVDAYLPALRHSDPALHRVYELQDRLERHCRDNELIRTENSGLNGSTAPSRTERPCRGSGGARAVHGHRPGPEER